MSKKALHTTPIEATKDDLKLALESVVRPLIAPLVKEIEALRLTFSISGKSELMTTGEIKREYGLARSVIAKYVKEGRLTPTFLGPTRYSREQIQKLISEKTLNYTTKLSKV